MSYTLGEVAHLLRDAQKKVQLIYAFNGTGKTRLSNEFKNLIAPKNNGEEESTLSRQKILYYNAFTEDLFYWDNDLERDLERKLKIQKNTFTEWLLKLLKDLGQDGNIVKYFQHYANSKLTPTFSEDLAEVTFSLERGNDEQLINLKISKGEESNFIWSVFYTLIEQVVETLNEIDIEYPEPTIFDELEYVFVDDPVSSLDENHLIKLAVDFASLIKSNNSKVRFIITTHNPLFYNILHNELGSNDNDLGYKAKHFEKYRLDKKDSNLYELEVQDNDSTFSYHLHLKAELEKAKDEDRLNKYHFNYLRNILEKTTIFFGYKKWSDLLPQTVDESRNLYEKRIINSRSHSKYSGEEVKELTEDEKRVLIRLIGHLDKIYKPNLRDDQSV
ncbi:AAA family ATPase [Acinetobacter baumannii]|nr:AAA family ATPase [Acinetobacter baumannii]